jgi:hypothetical protein
LKHLNAVLRKYFKEELPVMENAVGDLLIKPGYRKNMKKEIQKAWILDLQELLDPDLVDIVLNKDGIMIVCQNEQEGSFTIENMVKIKNIDYDAYDMCPIDLDNL